MFTFSCKNKEETLLTNFYQSSEKVGYLSYQRTVEILTSEANSLEFKNKRNSCLKEISELFKRNVKGLAVWGTFGFWGQCLFKTLIYTKNYHEHREFPLFKSLSNFDFFDAGITSSFFAINHMNAIFAECISKLCCTRKKNYKEFMLTIEKIHLLIEDLNYFTNPKEPVTFANLPSDINELPLSNTCLRAMLNEMNLEQTIELRRLLGREKFRSLFSLLSEQNSNVIKILTDLDFSRSIFEQIRQKDPKLFISFKKYLKNSPEIWKIMVKLKNQHSEEDEQILEEIGREILVNPNKVQFVMKKLRFEAHGTDAFEK